MMRPMTVTLYRRWQAEMVDNIWSVTSIVYAHFHLQLMRGVDFDRILAGEWWSWSMIDHYDHLLDNDDEFYPIQVSLGPGL